MKNLAELTQEQAIEIIEEVIQSYGYTGDYEGATFLVIETKEQEDILEEKSNMPLDELVKLAYGINADWGYSDEYTLCANCSKIIKTRPTSYSWKADYSLVKDCEIWCNECCKNDIETVLETYINVSDKAVTQFEIEELEDVGFFKIGENYENGWYGKIDNPNKIYDEVSKIYDEVIFFVTRVGQFHTDFIVMARWEGEEEDMEALTDLLDELEMEYHKKNNRLVIGEWKNGTWHVTKIGDKYKLDGYATIFDEEEIVEFFEHYRDM